MGGLIVGKRVGSLLGENLEDDKVGPNDGACVIMQLGLLDGRRLGAFVGLVG